MARFVRDCMTDNPKTLGKDATATEAAQIMKDADVGAVVVTEGDEICGIVTDRDIVIRGLAEGKAGDDIQLGDICTSDVTTLAPDDSLEDAVREMRAKHIRRLPVVEDGQPRGILSLGDLALELDKESGLAEISGAAPQH